MPYLLGHSHGKLGCFTVLGSNKRGQVRRGGMRYDEMSHMNTPSHLILSRGTYLIV